MTPEQTTEFKALVKEGFDFWSANASPEVKAKGEEIMAKYTSDPAFAEAEGAACAAAFAAADANGDGLLDAAEFEVFIAAMEQRERDAGYGTDPCPGHTAKMYATMNGITGGDDGIKLDQFFAGMGAYMAEWNTLKAGQ